MLGDLFKEFQRQAVEAAGTLVQPREEGGQAYWLRETAGGSLTRHETRTGPSRYELSNLDDFVRCTVALNEAAGDVKHRVFCGPEGAIAVANAEADKARDDHRARFPLTLTPEMAFLSGVSAAAEARLSSEQGVNDEEQVYYGHKQFLWMLRSRLLDALPDEFIEQMRAVEQKLTASASSDQGHGRESIGRSVQREVLKVGGNELPKDVTAQVPVYRELAEHESNSKAVRILVDVQYDDKVGGWMFALLPVSGELESVRSQVDAWLAGELRNRFGEDKVEVYAGRPHWAS